MTKSHHWQSRLSNEASIVKNHRGEWLIPAHCYYCEKKYLMSAKEHGKSGTCVQCKRTIHIPFIPPSLQVQCSHCGRRTLSSDNFCECGSFLQSP
ncbi:MAG: hypothetical protein AABZ60_09960 [Planctomycetota bacterium]